MNQNESSKNKRTTKKILIVIISVLIFLRILSLFAIYYLPHLEQYRHNNLLPAMYTGDDKGYHSLATMIFNFNFYQHDWTLGFPIVVSVFMNFFGTDFTNLFLPMVLFNGLFLYSLSIVLIVFSAFLIFQKAKATFLSGLFFVLFPFLFYVFRNFGPSFEAGNWNDFNFFHVNWLTMMSDPLSGFLVYLILFLIIIKSQKKINPIFFYSATGLLSGYAMMTRISNITIILSLLIIFFIFHKKEFSNFLFFLLGVMIGFFPQFLYNYKILGSPFSFGYQGAYQEWVSMGAAVRPIFSLSNITHATERAIDYSWLVIPSGLILLAMTIIGLIYISKIKKEFFLILLLFFLTPVIFYASFTTGQTSARYYIPAIQPIILIFLGFLYFLKENLNRHRLF